MIGKVYGPKRSRTSSLNRREDRVSYLDLINEGVIDPRKRRVGRGGVHKEKAEIGKYACLHGVTAAVQYHSRKLSVKLAVTTCD